MIEKWNQEFADVTNMAIAISSTGTNITASLSGVIEIDLVGRDLEQLKVAASPVESGIQDVPGVIKVKSDVRVASTMASVVVDPSNAMSVGLTPVQVAMNLNYILSGLEATTIKNAGEEYKVMLEYPAGQYDDMNALMNTYISSPMGRMIPLQEIASVVYTDAPETLIRVDGLYQVAVTATTTKAAKYTAQDEINSRMDLIEFPQGVSRSQNMMEEMMYEEFSAILQAIMIAVFLVFLVMAMQFESPRFSFMVMLSIPFSLIGSFGLLYLTNSTLSMVSLMGLLMLIGIVVNNGILYVDTVNMLKEEHTVEDALVLSGQIRLRPILMTTLTTVLSMVPMGLGIGEGAVLMQGMALVIIGGLIASTILILILLPSFYLVIYQKKQKNASKKRIVFNFKH